MQSYFLLWIPVLLAFRVDSLFRNYLDVDMWNFNGTLHLVQPFSAIQKCDSCGILNHWIWNWSICVWIPRSHLLCLWWLRLVLSTDCRRNSDSVLWKVSWNNLNHQDSWVFSFFLITYRLFGYRANISLKQLVFIAYAGMIRGAVAFGLVLRIDTSVVHRSVIVTTSLSLVVFTTVVLGSTVAAV